MSIRIANKANPNGSTSIGDGVENAHNMLLPVTAYDHKAMVVLTDGHENTAKFLADVQPMINERVFAIGLGTAEEINPVALTKLSVAARNDVRSDARFRVRFDAQSVRWRQASGARSLRLSARYVRQTQDRANLMQGGWDAEMFGTTEPSSGRSLETRHSYLDKVRVRLRWAGPDFTLLKLSAALPVRRDFSSCRTITV